MKVYQQFSGHFSVEHVNHYYVLQRSSHICKFELVDHRSVSCDCLSCLFDVTGRSSAVSRDACLV